MAPTMILLLLATTLYSPRAEATRMKRLRLGVIVPHSMFRQRQYKGAFFATLGNFQKARPAYNFVSRYEIQPEVVMVRPKLSPTVILDNLCNRFIMNNVSAILFLTNFETYGRETASAQYFLQLAGYLGIPVIAWNADSSGLERRASQSSLQLQLAPSLEHQTAAMLSILERYKWHQFSVVTSQIAGHDEFIQAVREQIRRVQPHFKMTVINNVIVSSLSDLAELANSEARIILLYSTREEARTILKEATRLNITGTNYLWLATQSVISSPLEAPREFPVGMLGVHFPTDDTHLIDEISWAVRVFLEGLELFTVDSEIDLELMPRLSCDGRGESHWRQGKIFYRYLRNVSVEVEQGKPKLEFIQDGGIKATELLIMNLRPQGPMQAHHLWEQIGVWKSWQKEGLDIKDIVWPGNSHTPPQGVPEKFHLRITFLEEPPYINLGSPDPLTGKCAINKGVFCRIAKEADIVGVDVDGAHRNSSLYQCCSGFCIDLLDKFAHDLGFTYELFRVEDGKWGAQVNGRWNGLVAALINHHADMVITSLKINYERSQAIDFSLPFLDTGIAIVVAKRTGIISPTAFLEPFDSAMWMLVALVAVHVAAVTIFFFEWLSPYGYDAKMTAPRDHRFSLCRTLWLVWAVLFQAAVNVDCPRGYTARCMANVWAMFALIFLAIYTANLAAFMITREEFHDLTGINDTKLSNPHSEDPPFRFGTIPHGNTDAVLRRNFPETHAYMRRWNRSTVLKGVTAVKQGELNAFIYDATVLEYLVGQDSECVLLTVGSWFAMTGYGVGFTKNSKYRALVNRQLMEYRENGDLERLQRFWFTGACNKPMSKEKQSRSEPLALEQFISTFLLLGSGILLAGVLLLMENLYCRYLKQGKHYSQTRSVLQGCCSLVSRSLGHSLKGNPGRQRELEMQKCQRTRGVQVQAPACCDVTLARLETSLVAAQRRILDLETELEIRGLRGVSVCQIHGTRGRLEKGSGSGGKPVWACLPLPSHTVHTQNWPRPQEYHTTPCDVVTDRPLEPCELWPPPVRMHPREPREIETVL